MGVLLLDNSGNFVTNGSSLFDVTITTEGEAQTAEFGDATPSGSGGFKPIIAGAEVDLTSYDSLVSGSLGAYTPSISSGALVFNATGAPDGAVLRCTKSGGGTIDITVSEVTGYTARGDTQLWAAIQSANPAIFMRPGDYDLDSQSTGNGIFNNQNRASNPTTVQGTHATLRPRFVDSRTKALNSTGSWTFRYIDWHMSASYCTSIGNNPTWIQSGNFINTTWEYCDFSGEAISDAALNAQTTFPAGGFPIPGGMKAGTGYTFRDCNFSYMYRALSLETDGACTLQRINGSYLYGDGIGINSPSSTDTGNNKLFEDVTLGPFFGIYNEETALSPHPDAIQNTSGTIHNLTLRRYVLFHGGIRGDSISGLMNNGTLADFTMDRCIVVTKSGTGMRFGNLSGTCVADKCTFLSDPLDGSASDFYPSSGSLTVQNSLVARSSTAGSITFTNCSQGFESSYSGLIAGTYVSPTSKAEVIASATPVASGAADTNTRGALDTDGSWRL